MPYPKRSPADAVCLCGVSIPLSCCRVQTCDILRNNLVEKIKMCTMRFYSFHNSQQVDALYTKLPVRRQGSIVAVRDVNYGRPPASLMIFINLRIFYGAQFMYLVISAGCDARPPTQLTPGNNHLCFLSPSRVAPTPFISS